MPMPRGRRPSTAALTRSGARKASEIVILTCRTLHFSRRAKLSDRGHSTRDHIIEPPTASRDGADQARPALELLRPDVASRCVVREQYLPGSLGGRFLPRNSERSIWGIESFVYVA
jgi:hypothetical protein